MTEQTKQFIENHMLATYRASGRPESCWIESPTTKSAFRTFVNGFHSYIAVCCADRKQFSVYHSIDKVKIEL